ncbi:uncharacterized protein LOC115788522 isoform X2 [Archocentrus centrarchus]|uniref:uncharacterized protein LOC115788522 isoform X2 n=1 Tax=Archocentrus centrarchus TaxID=63155 RepID=UPI0011EA4727|nr:uncharacterized protein LOC115788522 isoform X2 [Archocentrus centrarchus]
MAKFRNSVRFRTNQIKIKRKTIGGGVKFSYLQKSSSPPSLGQTGTPKPVTPLAENTDDITCNTFDEETAYSKAKRKEASLWDSLKDQILQVSYKSSAPSTNICIVCKENGEYRCLECSSTGVFCKNCIRKTHMNSLHLPEKWNRTHYEAAWLELVLHLPDDHITHGVYTRDVNIFVNTGQLCNSRVAFCLCEPEACTLLKYGLWPATPDKPQTAFSVALLELFHHLSLECQVSVEGFCNTLRWKNNLTFPEVNMLYRALVGESISQFHHYISRRRSLAGLRSLFDDGAVCPACPKTDGTMIVTMDANFGLVRKRSSGTSAAEPLHGNSMFVKDADVEEYLSSHPDSSKPAEDCSNFKAGNLLRSQNQQKILDVTGVFGAACRHEIPLMFFEHDSWRTASISSVYHQ